MYIYICYWIEYLDLLLRCLDKSSQKSSDPNGGSLMVMNPMVQSVKHHRISKSKLKMRGNLIPFFQRVVTGVIPKKKQPNCQRGTLLNNFQGEPKKRLCSCHNILWGTYQELKRWNLEVWYFVLISVGLDMCFQNQSVWPTGPTYEFDSYTCYYHWDLFFVPFNRNPLVDNWFGEFGVIS